jgi:hypothetical protein
VSNQGPTKAETLNLIKHHKINLNDGSDELRRINDELTKEVVALNKRLALVEARARLHLERLREYEHKGL